jgi:hypothetical protein
MYSMKNIKPMKMKNSNNTMKNDEENNERK